MPIKPENRSRYPKDWKTISARIRHVRALDRCECDGECGSHQSRCGAVNGSINMNGSRVVLTVAHLNHTPEDCREANLKAMCQACHLRYDAEHHRETRAASRRQLIEDAGQTALEMDHA